MIEPIVLEIVGYFLIYWLFSVWFGEAALYIVLALVVLSILLEVVFVLLSGGKKLVQKFRWYLVSENIHRYLYENNR